MTNVLVILTVDLLLVAAIFLLGTLVVRAILGKTDWLAFLSLSMGLGGGIFSWCLFIISWLGIQLNWIPLILIYGFLMLFFGMIIWKCKPQSQVNRQIGRKPDNHLEFVLTRSIWIVIITIVIATVILSIGLSYFGWDDLTNWTQRGYAIARYETVFAVRNWGNVGSSYPMNLPILISLFYKMDGDVLPGSKLLFPILFASLLIGCYRFWVFQGLRKAIAATGTLLLASTPIFFTHAYMGYANLPFTFYLAMGIVWCIDGFTVGENRKALMGGILLAIALWTRPEGIALCIGAILAFWLTQRFIQRKLSGILFTALPVLVVGSSWLLFMKIHATQLALGYNLAGSAVNGFLNGQFHFSGLYTIVRFIAGQLLRYRDYGIISIPLGLILLFRFRFQYIRNQPTKIYLIITSLILGSLVIGLHYMAAFYPGDPAFLYEWLSLDFTRVFMPVIVCLVLLGFLFTENPRKEILD